MKPPAYQFKLAFGWVATSNLVNVETFTAGGRYFYAPTLENDFVLQGVLSGGGLYDRGYTEITWKSDLWREQLDYLYDGLGGYSGKATFQTLRYFDSANYTKYQGWLALPQLNGVQRNFKMYQNVLWKFTRCVVTT